MEEPGGIKAGDRKEQRRVTKRPNLGLNKKCPLAEEAHVVLLKVAWSCVDFSVSASFLLIYFAF